MFALNAKFGFARHALNLFAHLIKGGVNAVPLSFDIFGNCMLNRDARLVKHGIARRHAIDEL